MTPAASPATPADLIASQINLDAAKSFAVDTVHGLLAAVMRADEPGGVRCLPVWSDGIDGLCVGSGHGVAAAHGIDTGTAVFVALDSIAGRTVSSVTTQLADALRDDGIDVNRWHARAAAIAAPVIEQAVAWQILAVAAHEVAHAVALPLDTTPPTETAAAGLRALATEYSKTDDSGFQVRYHGPDWAAAFAIVAARLIAIEPDCHRALHQRMLSDGEMLGGIDFDAVAAVVADVPHDAAIRPLLADADFVARVSAVVPTADERLAKLSAVEGPARSAVSDDSCGTAARKIG